MTTGDTLGPSAGKRTVTREKRKLAGVGRCRVYVTDNGNWYPSVTEITDFRPNPQKRNALRGFRRKYDGTGDTEHHTDVRAVKLHFGTLASYYTLQPLTDRDLWGESETAAERFLRNHGQFRGVDAWEWTRQRLPFVQRSIYRVLDHESIEDILGVERYILDADIGYGGQYDLCYVRRGEQGAETVLCEVTTGKDVYPNHELQITAYANAIDVDIDEVRIIRAHPTDGEGNGDLEVCTESEFDVSRDRRFEEFVGYTRQFHERITSAEASAQGQDSDVTDGLDREATVSDAGTETGTADATDPDEVEDEEEDPIAQFVEDHTGAPVPMGRSLRAAVNEGTVPSVARRNLGAEFDDETLLERLDDLLPEYESTGDGDSEPAVGASSDVTRSADTQRADDPKASVDGSNATEAGSAASESETTIVNISPTVAALLDRAVSTDERFADTRATVVDNALESFLTTMVGAELDPKRFTPTARELSVEADPVLRQLLELTSEADTRFEDADDIVLAALTEFLSLDERSTSVRLETFDQYRLIVETLLEDDDCPCESVDGVVEIALETHLLE